MVTFKFGDTGDGAGITHVIGDSEGLAAVEEVTRDGNQVAVVNAGAVSMHEGPGTSELGEELDTGEVYKPNGNDSFTV